MGDFTADSAVGTVASSSSESRTYAAVAASPVVVVSASSEDDATPAFRRRQLVFPPLQKSVFVKKDAAFKNKDGKLPPSPLPTKRVFVKKDAALENKDGKLPPSQLPTKRVFVKKDAALENKDGKLPPSQLPTKRVFVKKDAALENKDGKLPPSQLPTKRVFVKKDAALENKDGKLPPSQLPTKRVFVKKDAALENKDGKLPPSQLPTKRAFVKKDAALENKDGKLPPSQLPTKRVFVKKDAALENKDGKLPPSQLPTKRVFVKKDAALENKDGKLPPSQLPTKRVFVKKDAALENKDGKLPPSHICTECEIQFKEKNYLRIHMRNIHGVKASHKKPEFTCEHCNKMFGYKKNLISHVKKYHMVIPDRSEKTRKTRLICPYEPCDKGFMSYSEIRSHLYDVHKVTMDLEKLSLKSVEEFKQWKKKYEEETASFYALGHNYCLLTGEKKQLYNCHRSFKYSSRGTGKRAIKNIGSNKTGKVCPSIIDVKITTSNEYEVKVWKTHVGHDNDVGRTKLHEDTRGEIAGKLSQGVSLNRVLDDIRDNVQESARESLINRKDLNNILRDFNITYSTKRHTDDAVSIKLWVSDMKDLGDDSPILFYKGQNEKDESGVLSNDDFALILMTKFQSNQLKKFGHDKICIDGTHGTNAYKFHLFSTVTVEFIRYPNLSCYFEIPTNELTQKAQVYGKSTEQE